MLSTESEQLLNEIYYNVNHPAGFSNVSRLYHAVKGKGIKFQDVREFFKSSMFTSVDETQSLQLYKALHS